MADEGTLATTAQVLFFVGENATANQILEANTNYAILMAEALIYVETDRDWATEWNDTSKVNPLQRQAVTIAACAKAAEILVNQNQNAWQLATTTNKLNTLGSLYTETIKRIKETDL